MRYCHPVFAGFVSLGHTNLTDADLSDAWLHHADLNRAVLWRANLARASLFRTNLSNAFVHEADFTNVAVLETNFSDIDLSEVKGLQTVKHDGPSTVGIDTIYKSKGKIPEAFLRGCGVPDEFISYICAMVGRPIEFYSCFISYSDKEPDKNFAEQLHSDLQSMGVRCWFAPHDMPIGAKIIDALDEGIRLRDKVLLILSEGAIASDWVEGEVTRALDEERTRKQVMLFPVRLDDAVMQTSEAWARLLRGQRNIGDFTRWKEHDSYRKSFERLMRDLRVEKPGQ